jgi:hypothetical protein
MMDARRHFLSFCVAFAIFFFSGVTLFGSDTVLIHGHVYTGNPKAPWVQALAISGSRVDAVGTDGGDFDPAVGQNGSYRSARQNGGSGIF